MKQMDVICPKCGYRNILKKKNGLKSFFNECIVCGEKTVFTENGAPCYTSKKRGCHFLKNKKLFPLKDLVTKLVLMRASKFDKIDSIDLSRADLFTEDLYAALMRQNNLRKNDVYGFLSEDKKGDEDDVLFGTLLPSTNQPNSSKQYFDILFGIKMDAGKVSNEVVINELSLKLIHRAYCSPVCPTIFQDNPSVKIFTKIRVGNIMRKKTLAEELESQFGTLFDVLTENFEEKLKTISKKDAPITEAHNHSHNAIILEPE